MRFGDWLTDRLARRPSGVLSRDGYRDPTHHRPNFLAILSALRLKSDDYLLEIGCGGGAFLQNALTSGCKAAGLDHSPDMVQVAMELNRKAVSEGRLKIVQGEANHLPYPDGTFTCAVMTNVFGFLTDPIVVLTEIRRVISAHGRIAIFTLSPELKGTMAAPEPIASRLHFYTDKELTEMAEKAGFVKIHVERPDLEPFAREAKLPEDVVADFRGGRDSQLLLAWKK
jgi:ubiquinone/menaquinone biosynthesis C-methylase UbiE